MDETGRRARARKLTHKRHATDISGWGLLTANGATVLSASTKWFVLAGLSRHIRAGSQILNTTAAFAIASYSAGARTLAVWATNADASAPLPLVVDLSSFSSACRGLSVARFATDFNGKGDLCGSIKTNPEPRPRRRTLTINIDTPRQPRFRRPNHNPHRHTVR